MSAGQGDRVRVAALADHDAVERVLAASYPALLAPDYEPALLAELLPWLTRCNPTLLASGTYYVATDGAGVIRGCGGWTAEAPGGGPVTPGLAHLRHFATDPAYTRRGVGRALVERCLADAAAEGRDRVEAWSTLSAASFYEALGFRVDSTMDVEFPEGLRFPGVRMLRG